MTLLRRYEEFLARVDELGFMSLSSIFPGLPSLATETPKEIWHTGDPDTDPWCWKDRAAEDKRLAFGCILGGHKGFVAPRWYRLFYAAYHPPKSMEERWAAGQVSQETHRLWQLFERENTLDTSAIRQHMNVSARQGGGAIDRAVQELQRQYYLTVAGNQRKVDKQGRPYGWPANVYQRVIDWIPETWLRANETIEPEEARERILDEVVGINSGLDRAHMAKVLRLD